MVYAEIIYKSDIETYGTPKVQVEKGVTNKNKNQGVWFKSRMNQN